MWLRRAFNGWLIPAAFLLPLWLFVGSLVFRPGGWLVLWMVIAIPVVFIGELVLTFLVRARGTVRAHRALSWWDVLGFTVWHGLIISLGFYDESWFGPALIAATVVGIGLFWLTLWQLLREAKPSGMVMYTTEGVAYMPPAREQTSRPAPDPDVIVLTEIRDADKR